MTPNETIRREFAPFIQSLLAPCENDPKLQAQLQIWLTKFLDALLEAYDAETDVSLRAYLMQGLTRYALALAAALRPEEEEAVSVRSPLTLMDEKGFNVVAVVERRDSVLPQAGRLENATEAKSHRLMKLA